MDYYFKFKGSLGLAILAGDNLIRKRSKQPLIDSSSALKLFLI